MEKETRRSPAGVINEVGDEGKKGSGYRVPPTGGMVERYRVTKKIEHGTHFPRPGTKLDALKDRQRVRLATIRSL